MRNRKTRELTEEIKLVLTPEDKDRAKQLGKHYSLGMSGVIRLLLINEWTRLGLKSSWDAKRARDAAEAAESERMAAGDA